MLRQQTSFPPYCNVKENLYAVEHHDKENDHGTTA